MNVDLCWTAGSDFCMAVESSHDLGSKPLGAKYRMEGFNKGGGFHVGVVVGGGGTALWKICHRIYTV